MVVRVPGPEERDRGVPRDRRDDSGGGRLRSPAMIYSVPALTSVIAALVTHSLDGRKAPTDLEVMVPLFVVAILALTHTLQTLIREWGKNHRAELPFRSQWMEADNIGKCTDAVTRRFRPINFSPEQFQLSTTSGLVRVMNAAQGQMAVGLPAENARIGDPDDRDA